MSSPAPFTSFAIAHIRGNRDARHEGVWHVLFVAGVKQSFFAFAINHPVCIVLLGQTALATCQGQISRNRPHTLVSSPGFFWFVAIGVRLMFLGIPFRCADVASADAIQELDLEAQHVSTFETHVAVCVCGCARKSSTDGSFVGP